MKRKHDTRYTMLSLLSLFIMGLMTVVLGCTQKEAVVEPEIPSHYTTYSDEAGLFSISYPPEWEPALSVIGNLEGTIKEIITSVETDIPVEGAHPIFFAGIPTEMGYAPVVNIVVERLPEGVNTHDGYVEATIRGVKMVIDDYHEFSRISTTVDGRKATIVNGGGTFPQLGTFHSLQLSLLVGKSGWTITCMSPEGEFSKWEADFNHILQSLRIHK